MDTISPTERSRIMARVKSKGNKSTESAVVAIFRASRISGWRRHCSLAGKPDFSFPKQMLAVFVDGCFWHGCPRHCRMPSTNRKYWTQKIARNVQRDRDVIRELRNKGWRCIRFWEHDLCGGTGLTRKMKRLKRIVQQDKSSVRGIPRR